MKGMEGNFVGIIGGISTCMRMTLTVIKPVVNGPSERAGIKSGDQILFANKQQLFNKKIKCEKLSQNLKGRSWNKSEFSHL